MKKLIPAAMLAAWLLGPSVLAAAPAPAPRSVRYALVVGNNFGRTPPGLTLPELKHAESEAARLREKLVALGNFDPSPLRTAVVLGKSRDEILAAARRIAEQHRADRQALGEVPTLFAFFFTGHGLAGQLLTASDPLTGADLAAVFGEVGATFTVGVFDACFSGSLDLKALSAKGMTPTLGFNAFEALPQEVINAQGTMWFVSSRPDQVSYEDERLGGVFTHFFMEAMDHAPRTGFGITLEDLWEYARAGTQRYTSEATRPQTPQRLIRNLTSTGPLFFSFPARRSAVLELDAPVSGRFLVRYESGQLSELIVKEPGQSLRVAVYPAEAVIERVDDGGQQRVRLTESEAVRVSEATGWLPRAGLGSRRTALAAKGHRIEGLVLTREEPAASLLVDLGYQVSVGPRHSALPRHGAVAGLRLDRGLLEARLAYAFGQQKERSESWGYTLGRHGLELGAGPAFGFGSVRLGVTATAALAFARVTFEDGERKTSAAWGGSACFDALWRVTAEPVPVHLQLRAGVLAERSRPVVPADAGLGWSLAPVAWVGIARELM